MREELVREQGLSAVSQERAAVSERQLSIAQERLGEILALSSIEMWLVLLKYSRISPLPSFPPYFFPRLYTIEYFMAML